MPKYLINSNRPSQPPDVVKVELPGLDGSPGVRSQWERDDAWFDGNDRREVRARLMIEPERVEFQLHIPPGRRGVVIIARCRCCHRLYISPVVRPEADVAQLLRMSEDKILASLDGEAGRFFQHICSQPNSLGECSQCGGHR